MNQSRKDRVLWKCKKCVLPPFLYPFCADALLEKDLFCWKFLQLHTMFFSWYCHNETPTNIIQSAIGLQKLKSHNLKLGKKTSRVVTNVSTTFWSGQQFLCTLKQNEAVLNDSFFCSKSTMMGSLFGSADAPYWFSAKNQAKKNPCWCIYSAQRS